MSDNKIPYLSAPVVVNIQLNSFCPLSCPFCFMSFADKKEMEWDKLKNYLIELKEMGCKTVSFGQGEPMVSTSVFKAVKFAHELGLRVNIVTSGYGITYNKLVRLKNCGLNEIRISLNSFKKEINEKSRDGFEYAINAVEIAKVIQMPFSMVYVAQEETMIDFEQYINKAIGYGAIGITVLREKMNHSGKIGQYSETALKILHDCVIKSEIPIAIEECFCELKLLSINHIPSALQGCAAGRALMAISVDGEFMPCPHLYKKKEIKGAS